MQFPYIPISYVIADVRAELKQLDQSGEILEEDCINTIVELLREVGGGNYVQKSSIVHICNNVASLPDDWYVTDQIWIMEDQSISGQFDNDDTLIWFSKERRSYRKTGLIFPGDSMTGTNYSMHNQHPDSAIGKPTYIIRHPKQIRTSLNKCVLGLTYLSLPSDESGSILMQDEIYTIKAAKAYLKRSILSERYYMGRLNQNIWDNITNEYDINLSQAQAIFKFPDPADAKAMGYNQDHRYDNFKLR